MSEYFVCTYCEGSLEVDKEPEDHKITRDICCPWCGSRLVCCPDWDTAYALRSAIISRRAAESKIRTTLEKINKIIADKKAAEEKETAGEAGQ